MPGSPGGDSRTVALLRDRTSSERAPARTASKTDSPRAWPRANPRIGRWNRADRGRAKSWDDHVRHVEELAASPGFRQLREQIINAARLKGSDRVLDVGAGTGLLTLAAAAKVGHVIALDSSPAMSRHLETELARRSIDNADVVVGTASELPLADTSIDVVLSNYCFHHLKDEDKHRALSEAIRVLRPNGRLVVGDMMFQIGFGQSRDRAVVFGFARKMLRRGPAGMLRIAKNAIRLLTGRGEYPASVDWWRHALDQAGFAEIAVRALQHEGGIATARRPEPSRPHPIRKPRPNGTTGASSRPGRTRQPLESIRRPSRDGDLRVHASPRDT